MKSSALLTLALIFSLAACAAVRESRLNPFNWFGNSRAETRVVVDERDIDRDGRILVDQIVSMRVNQTPGGAVVEAVGLPPTQGFWQVELVPQNDGLPVDGVLTYEFRVAEPTSRQAQGTQFSREVTGGTAISNIRLQGVREIRVLGLRNFRSSRR